jgi:ABC-2 type transport system ATP-binding protein
MSEMSLTADHLIIIGRGRLLADMSTKDFIEHSSHNYVLLRLHEIFLQRSSLEEAYMEMTHDSVEYHTEAATPGVAEGEQ